MFKDFDIIACWWLMKHIEASIQKPLTNTIGVHLPNQVFFEKQVRTVQYLAEFLNINCTT